MNRISRKWDLYTYGWNLWRIKITCFQYLTSYILGHRYVAMDNPPCMLYEVLSHENHHLHGFSIAMLDYQKACQTHSNTMNPKTKPEFVVDESFFVMMPWQVLVFWSALCCFHAYVGPGTGNPQFVSHFPSETTIDVHVVFLIYRNDYSICQTSSLKTNTKQIPFYHSHIPIASHDISYPLHPNEFPVTPMIFPGYC